MEAITKLLGPPDGAPVADVLPLGTREAVPVHLRAWASALRRRDCAGVVVPITAAPSLRVIRPSDPFDAVGGKPSRPKPSRWPRTPRRREVPRPPVRRVRQLLIPLQRDEAP